jgi:diguanylate cyclase (GGDEF)-like protein
MRLGLQISRLFAVLLVAWLAGATAYAEAPRIDMCVMKLADGQDVAVTMAQSRTFACNIRQTTLGAGNFLTELRFAPVKAKVDDPLVLRLGSEWQDSTKVNFVYADGVRSEVGFTSGNLHRFMTIGAVWEIPVPARSAPLQSVFVETRGSANVRGIVLSPQLMTRTESYALRLGLTAAFAAFAGLAVALFAYNSALWMAMRHSFQLWYCAMITAFALYTFSSSGLLMMVADGLDNNDRLRLNYVLLTLVTASAFQFIRHFFGRDVFGPRLSWMTQNVIAFSLLTGLLFAVLAPWQIKVLDRLYFIAMSVLLSMIVPVLISAWRSRNRYFWMFVLAWSAPIFTAALRAVQGFDLIGHSFLLDHGNTIALSVEALLSSLLVTSRLRELGLERDHAVRGEQTARRLANTDSLTGLMNRRAFIDFAIGRTGRYRLMLIDIDRFKAVNDKLGHEAGDQVLRAVANVIQRCRPQDSLAVRLGGEEFALLVARSAYESCKPEMVLQAVRSEPMPQGSNVTVSIGYADGSVVSEESWKRLYRLADAALYRAKADGRDRSCRATDFRAAA